MNICKICLPGFDCDQMVWLHVGQTLASVHTSLERGRCQALLGFFEEEALLKCSCAWGDSSERYSINMYQLQ